MGPDHVVCPQAAVTSEAVQSCACLKPASATVAQDPAMQLLHQEQQLKLEAGHPAIDKLHFLPPLIGT